MNLDDITIGAIGLGQMGGGIATNLARAGYDVLGLDPKETAQARLRDAGGRIAPSIDAIVDACAIILLCVEGKISIRITRESLVPGCRPGQIVIDHSTVPAPETRAMGQALAEKGVRYLDVPISGGAGGAAAGTLRMFAGGDPELYALCLPLFHVAGNPDKVHHYGPVGMGQVAKVVQQLTVRWPDMARLEVMAFGIRSGLDKQRLMQALDVDPDGNDRYAILYRFIEQENKEPLAGLISEWPYFLAQARSIGMRLPMMEALYDFCKDGELVTVDPVSRPMPSVWDELLKGHTGEP